MLSYTVTDSAGTSGVLIQAHAQQQQQVTESEFSLFWPPEVNAIE